MSFCIIKFKFLSCKTDNIIYFNFRHPSYYYYNSIWYSFQFLLQFHHFKFKCIFVCVLQRGYDLLASLFPLGAKRELTQFIMHNLRNIFTKVTVACNIIMLFIPSVLSCKYIYTSIKYKFMNRNDINRSVFVCVNKMYSIILRPIVIDTQ